MLLAESLLLCGAGAALGVWSAQWIVEVLARYASRFSVRALDLTVDSSLLWVGGALAIVAALILAFVPRLPSAAVSGGGNRSSGSLRITGSAGRQRIFVVTQIGASFVLLAGASMLLTTLSSCRRTESGIDTRRVLAINVPVMSYGKTRRQVVDFYKDVDPPRRGAPRCQQDRLRDDRSLARWRRRRPSLQFCADGHIHSAPEDDPRAQFRVVSPGFFAALGVPIVAGRDFNDLDGQSEETRRHHQRNSREAHVPQSGRRQSARVLDRSCLEGHGDPGDLKPQRIVGVAADIDDEHLVPEPTVTIYHPLERVPSSGGRLFIHTSADPYSLITPVTRMIREMSVEQPIERAATLEEARAEVLTPQRLSSVVFGMFAAVALLIAAVGVAGVLAFSVSARTKEFGIRLALGLAPRNLLKGVVAEGVAMAAIGIGAAAVLGFALATVARSYFADLKMPGVLPVVASAVVLMTVAVVASMLPAARAARVDVIQALRSE